MKRVLDWQWKMQYVRKLSEDALRYAIRDCFEAAKAAHGWDADGEGYYHDESSVYQAELARRIKR